MPQYMIAALRRYRRHLERKGDLTRLQQADLDYINDRLGLLYEDNCQELG